jgi:hypothetical protein
VKKFFISLSISLLIFSSSSSLLIAQNITMETTMKYINKNLGNKSSIEIIRGILIFKVFEKGELFREDKMAIREVDEKAIAYKPDEKAVIIPCLKGEEECVIRKLYANNIKKPYSRLNIMIDQGDKKGESMAKALIHAVMLTKDPKYKSSVPFE